MLNHREVHMFGDN